MERDEIIKLIGEQVKAQLAGPLFTARKIGDTPTDNLSLVPRKYVNISSNLSARPASIAATTGQRFYATDISVPLVFDGTNWRDGIGSIRASN